MIQRTKMLQEIREQPDLLQSVNDQVRDLLNQDPGALKTCRTLLLAGCGDMDFSSRTAAWAAQNEQLGVKAHRAIDCRWVAPYLTKDDLVIAASFSGRTPRTIEAALIARRRCATVWGLTGNAESPLAEAVDRVLLLRTDPQEELDSHTYAGYRHIIPQTKTFTAVLLAQLRLLAGAGRLDSETLEALDRLPGAIARSLPVIENAVDRFMTEGFRPVARAAFLGSGPWRGLAGYGAAKLLEMAIPARWQCLEENNHLEMFVTQKEDLVVFIAPDRNAWTRARELLKPYGRFDALRLLIAPSDLLHADHSDISAYEKCGAWIAALPPADRTTQIFQTAIALQLLTAAIGPALGRDIDQWVGGVRTGLIEELGLKLVRASKIVDDL